ncbi:DUF1772 domain-containing protein [Sciscionella marina]|uniref:DUF1772 domain-containing protein n=1 Tax=Sciscionella marina TaxID=508770 RepID=UPI00037DA019|nr:DUF1772 domain-containing protein [Sciscionella marina]
MHTTLGVLAVLSTGLLVGVELSVVAVVHPILARMPGDSALLGRVAGARRMGRLMPFGYAAATGCTVLLTAVEPGGQGARWSLAAAILLALSIVLSVALLVPINNRAAGWEPGRVPADWRAQLRRWDRLHYLRLAIIGTGFVLLVLGWGR